MNGPAEQAAIEFSSEPSPPRKGANTLSVKLTDARGESITQAQVKVTFYMPAMPAMGMAAINKGTALADKGNGTYEGSLELPSGGSYQVTITAAKDGKTVASKQLNITATGGM
jgi:Cu(I)/Ag(I) efflux system membrane fusion protein/cobalt-zinc-cadmium efflux system membrane fusion protein